MPADLNLNNFLCGSYNVQHQPPPPSAAPTAVCLRDWGSLPAGVDRGSRDIQVGAETAWLQVLSADCTMAAIANAANAAAASTPPTSSDVFVVSNTEGSSGNGYHWIAVAAHFAPPPT